MLIPGDPPECSVLERCNNNMKRKDETIPGQRDCLVGFFVFFFFFGGGGGGVCVYFFNYFFMWLESIPVGIPVSDFSGGIFLIPFFFFFFFFFIIGRVVPTALARTCLGGGREQRSLILG